MNIFCAVKQQSRPKAGHLYNKVSVKADRFCSPATKMDQALVN